MSEYDKTIHKKKEEAAHERERNAQPIHTEALPPATAKKLPPGECWIVPAIKGECEEQHVPGGLADLWHVKNLKKSEKNGGH